MLQNVYILHIDEPRSLQYLDDCVRSCKEFPGLNVIPVQGYKGASYKDICKEFGLDIIPFYVNQMDTNGDTLNKAFSCTAGHIKIWQMIVESGEPGVVLEHDAIVKGPLAMVDVDDDEILWLGPRIEFEHEWLPKFNLSLDEQKKKYTLELNKKYPTPAAAKQKALGSVKSEGLKNLLDNL